MDKNLFDLISEIVEKHIKEIWITPYYKTKQIPNEEIWSLKNDLYEILKERRKKSGSKL